MDKVNVGKDTFYFSGDNIQVSKNIVFKNPNRIYIGSNIQIKQNCEFTVNDSCNKQSKWNIKIDDNVFFNKDVILESFNNIIIGKYVMFGPQVYISDNNHEYYNYNVPIRLQGFPQNKNKILIKDGAWIGAGCRIIGDVTIGFGSIIRANTVVVKDVPDHCVVVGTPGRVIKICDYRTNKWINVKNSPKLLKEILSKRGNFNGYNYNWINEEIEKSHINKEQTMEKADELVKHKELIDTIIEGLNYVNNQLKVGKFDNSIKIFNDMIIGINTVVCGLTNIININQNKNKIDRYLVLVASAYEKRDIEKIILNIDTGLIPIMKEIRNNC